MTKCSISVCNIPKRLVFVPSYKKKSSSFCLIWN
uniref:Uncharacterized protein n=1 Tax=Rhizophora mucronata TaxID=61149 RepID=A0A2P2Q2Y1_RHIMU